MIRWSSAVFLNIVVSHSPDTLYIVAILIISSELPEILGICERIYVMGEGKIRGEFQRSEATQEKILACAERGVLR